MLLLLSDVVTGAKERHFFIRWANICGDVCHIYNAMTLMNLSLVWEVHEKKNVRNAKY